MESYEDKTLRVAIAIWVGFGGDAEDFPKMHGDLRKKYLDAGRAALEEEARDIEETA